MRKISVSDCSAIARLLILLYDATKLTNVAEPRPGFTPAVVASSFLLDLIKRNREVCVTRAHCERLVENVKMHTDAEVTLRVREYRTRNGRIAKLYGIQVDKMTLWFVYSAPEPKDNIDLSIDTQIEPDVPVAIKQAAAVPVPLPAEPLTYFESLRELPERQREWLLMQHEAIFTALNKPELYASFLKEMKGVP